MNIVEVVRVRFRWPGKMYEFRNPLELPLKRGASVVVQTDDGDELIGTVMIAPRLRLARREDEVLPTVLRIASDRELGMASVTDESKLEIKSFFDTRMRSREMNGVKLVDIEKANGGQKLILYFASEQKRFNYREMAIEMAHRFKVRVDMRPIGIRDAARLSGGIGKCGLSLCCSTWLPDFQQISIRMAKDQGLSLDPESINGQCGRLLCCLGYEHQNYLELGQGLPKVGKAVLTPKGDARVVKLDILSGKITVRLEDGIYETYHTSEVKRKFGPGGQVHDTNSDDDSDDGVEAGRNDNSFRREDPRPTAEEPAENFRPYDDQSTPKQAPPRRDRDDTRRDDSRRPQQRQDFRPQDSRGPDNRRPNDRQQNRPQGNNDRQPNRNFADNRDRPMASNTPERASENPPANRDGSPPPDGATNSQDRNQDRRPRRRNRNRRPNRGDQGNRTS